MAEETTERIYVIPLKRKGYKASIAAPTAVKRVKQYLQKHMKANEKDIWIDGSLNNELWSKGKYKMPNKVRVKAVKFEDGVVEAYLPELEFEKSRREILQDEKAKKQPILRKDEEIDEEEEMEEDVSGTEDYDVVPTADGDVKIKKKKQPKDKEETDTEDEESKEPEAPTKPKETKKETPKKSTEPKEKKEKSSEKTTKKPAEKPKEPKAKPKAATSDKKEKKSAEKPAKEKKSEEKSKK